MSTDFARRDLQRLLNAHLADPPTIASVPPVSRPEGRHPGICRITLADGSRLIAKQQLFAPLAANSPYDLFETDRAVANVLNACSLPHARIRAVVPEAQIVFYHDAGHLPLADTISLAHPVARAGLSRRVVRAFVAFQAALANAIEPLGARVFPGCDEQGLRESWSEVTARLTSSALAPIVDISAGTVQSIHALAQDLGTRPAVLGPTDYNARNVILDAQGTVIFVDLAKVGYDWPDRRLVQYATALAPRPLSLVDSDTVREYVAAVREAPRCPFEAVSEDLDAHHLLFFLHLSSRIASNPVLLSRHRRILLRALGTPLSSSPEVSRIRASFPRS